jgi:hypothetical protein
MQEIAINPELELDSDREDHRRALIRALAEEGLDPYEYHSGGGLMHVVVDLVNEEGGEDLLQIATGSVASPCDVGLMGWNENGNVQDESYTRTPMLGDAVAAFKRYWSEKEVWVTRFRAGELNL